LALSAAAFGLAGVLAHLGLAAYATMQLLMSDYVQHYGLQRRRGENGRYEPVSPRHSWNARQVFSSFLMLNAPRHSDHHAHPSHPYPGLTLPGGADAPRLPFSLPMMGVIALFPPLWFRMMNKRARRWAAEVQDSAGHGAGTVAN